jgi:hypothetical protein
VTNFGVHMLVLSNHLSVIADLHLVVLAKGQIGPEQQ